MGIHDKCGALARYDGGPMLMCARSTGHTTRSKEERRRRHYDPNEEVMWDADRVYDEAGNDVTPDKPRVTDIPGRTG